MIKKNYDLAYLGWCTYYESNGSRKVFNNESLSIKRPCFHLTYPRTTNEYVEQNIKIAIKKGTRTVARHNNHYCPFTYDEIVKHISYLKELVNFDFTIENKPMQYIINVNFSGEGIYFRVLVSWIRYLYEFPANMAMKDVYKIMKLKAFKDINVFALSTFVLDCLYYGYYFDDQLCDNRHISKISSIEELKKHLSFLATHSGRTMGMFDCAELSLNKMALFNKNRNVYKKCLTKNNILTCYNYGLRHLFDWINEDIFKERINLYKKNIKLLKNE